MKTLKPFFPRRAVSLLIAKSSSTFVELLSLILLTLRNALATPIPQFERKCKIAACTINGKMCFEKMVVYGFECCSCGLRYIGSTERFLHQRVREHYTSPKSGVFIHKQACQSPFHLTILKRARDGTELRILEALAIREVNPALNSRDEIKLWEPHLC